MKNLIRSTLLALALGSCAAHNVEAAIVSFTVSGTLDYVSDPSNSLPASIQYGGPVTGTITYDTSAVAFMSLSTNEGDFYFGTNGGLSMSMTVGGHTFTNVKHVSEFPYASINVLNDFNGSRDSFEMEDAMPNLRMDGGPLPGDATAGAFGFDLEDNTGSALNSAALPTAPLVLASFPSTHRFQINASKGNASLFVVSALITNIVAAGQPPLAIKILPDKSVLLSWPISFSGYGLLQNTNAALGAGWTTNATSIVDTATDHTVTLPGSKTQCLFRLKSP